ncbi:ferritin-like domain-containing protein [Dipodascopsis uninucleata]
MIAPFFAVTVALVGAAYSADTNSTTNSTLPSNTTTTALNPYGTGYLEVNTTSGIYNATGNLTSPEPEPYTPSGMLGSNGSLPNYHPITDFDYESLTLALYQEYIELDLFQYGLQKFSAEEFEEAGLDVNDRALIEFMAEQEQGHATLLTNIIGPSAATQCQYSYDFETVAEFVDFCQRVTSWGESGVYGFLEHLDSRSAAQLLLQSITTEARQQMIFRQFEGLFPMPVYFETGITQSMAWTLLAPYITSCDEETPRLGWQNFPGLNVTFQNGTESPYFLNTTTNSTSTSNATITPGITSNLTSLSSAGTEIQLIGELPGKPVGPNLSYITNTTAGEPKFAAWISQINVTYTDIESYEVDNQTYTWTATTTQPDDTIWEDVTMPIVNGSMFIVVTDEDIYVTPYNLSELNAHVVAGPAVFVAG